MSLPLDGYKLKCMPVVIPSVQGINLSLPVFASCQDCLSYLASTETIQDLCFLQRLLFMKKGFLPWLSTQQEAICWIMYSSLGRMQEIQDSVNGSQIWRTVSVGSDNWPTSLYPVALIISGLFPLCYSTFPLCHSVLELIKFIWQMLFAYFLQKDLNYLGFTSFTSFHFKLLSVVVSSIICFANWKMRWKLNYSQIYILRILKRIAEI